MPPTSIIVENLSKQYRLGTVGTGTISHDLNRWWARMRGKEDPYLKIGEANDRSTAGSSDYVWSLKDINFEVEQGEVLGIIGKNGAGKSTLLKILSKVTGPTTGRVMAKGRIGALLEVGTGFHPELTGRENIFLNGAILGMKKHEINAKLDEIIDFSGCARYIDTPTKRYSSGMKVRLAFAVAAFLEPEILIVDEVLAVGDAEFQKKAIGKMQDVSKGEGRTVLFVSHNMAAVESLCSSVIVLENGCIHSKGRTKEMIQSYLAGSSDLSTNHTSVRRSFSIDTILKYFKVIISPMHRDDGLIVIGDTLSLEFSLEFEKIQTVKIIELSCHFRDRNDLILATLNPKISGQTLKTKGSEFNFKAEINDLNINTGIYSIDIFLKVNSNVVLNEKDVLRVEFKEGGFYTSGNLPKSNPILLLKPKWIVDA